MTDTRCSTGSIGLPDIPDDDKDFSPGLARKIISTYQQIIYDLTDGITGTLQKDELERLRTAAQAALGCGDRNKPAPDPCADLSINELIEWLDSPQYTNGHLDFEATNHMSAAAELLDKAYPESISAPLPADDKGEAYAWHCTYPRYGHLTLRREEMEQAAKDGAQIIPLFAAPQPASNAGGGKDWEPVDFWKFVSGLSDEHQADQMRDMLAQKGLQIVGANDLAYAWQDISTAPKDGKRILLFQAGRGAFEGWWHTAWPHPEEYWMDDADSEPNPTHWRPTLALPSTHQSAPDFFPSHSSDERLPSSDAVGSGADTAIPSTPRGGEA